jgi:hypothetical protein
MATKGADRHFDHQHLMKLMSARPGCRHFDRLRLLIEISVQKGRRSAARGSCTCPFECLLSTKGDPERSSKRPDQWIQASFDCEYVRRVSHPLHQAHVHCDRLSSRYRARASGLRLNTRGKSGVHGEETEMFQRFHAVLHLRQPSESKCRYLWKHG